MKLTFEYDKSENIITRINDRLITCSFPMEFIVHVVHVEKNPLNITYVPRYYYRARENPMAKKADKIWADSVE